MTSLAYTCVVQDPRTTTYLCFEERSPILTGNRVSKRRTESNRVVVVMAIRVQYEGNNSIGVFTRLTNTYCLVPVGSTENYYRWVAAARVVCRGRSVLSGVSLSVLSAKMWCGAGMSECVSEVTYVTLALLYRRQLLQCVRRGTGRCHACCACEHRWLQDTGHSVFR